MLYLICELLLAVYYIKVQVLVCRTQLIIICESHQRLPIKTKRTINTYANSTPTYTSTVEKVIWRVRIRSICNFHMFPRVVSTIFRDFFCLCVSKKIFSMCVGEFEPKKWVTLSKCVSIFFRESNFLCTFSSLVCVCVYYLIGVEAYTPACLFCFFEIVN